MGVLLSSPPLSSPELPELHKVHLTLLTRGAAGIPSKDTHRYSEDAVQECGGTG